MSAIRLMPRRARETREHRDLAVRPRARGKTADALARATDSGTRECSHGRWIAWLKEIGLPRRTATLYIVEFRNALPEVPKSLKRPKALAGFTCYIHTGGAKMTRRAPIPAPPDAFVKPPTKAMLMSGGRPIFTLSRGGC